MVGLSKKRVFPKTKGGLSSLFKIEHKNTATLDSARSKKKSKVAVLQLKSLPVSFLVHKHQSWFVIAYLWFYIDLGQHGNIFTFVPPLKNKGVYLLYVYDHLEK